MFPFTHDQDKVSTALWIARIGRSCVAIAVGYALAKLKHRLLAQWTNYQIAHAHDANQEEDEPHHLHFYNLVLNTIIVCLVTLRIGKICHIHGARAGLQSFFAASGLGAVVFGIASRHVAEQVVGGLVLAATDVYEEGDKICLPESNNLQGFVRRVGLLDTDIESLDHTLIQIPNSRILTQHVVNLSRVKRSRVHQTIRLSYQDLPKVPALVQRIPLLIEQAASPLVLPTSHAQRPIRAHLTNLCHDHVEVVVTCHLQCRPGSPAFLQGRQQVLLAIAQAVKECRAEFALPTSVWESQGAPSEEEPQPGGGLDPHWPTMKNSTMASSMVDPTTRSTATPNKNDEWNRFRNDDDMPQVVPPPSSFLDLLPANALTRTAMPNSEPAENEPDLSLSDEEYDTLVVDDEEEEELLQEQQEEDQQEEEQEEPTEDTQDVGLVSQTKPSFGPE